MQIKDAVVFITGANRGLGLEFAKQALARGAKKVYAAARDVSTITLPGVVPVQLDVTKPEQVAAAARACGDVTLVINNAGIGRVGGIAGDNAETVLREQLETNLFGVFHVARAFAPVLARNAGGALLNMLSILSWVNTPMLGAYGVSKSAAWALTNSLRAELKPQGTLVVGFHGGFIDTDMIRDFDVPKAKPEDVVSQSLDAIEQGVPEVSVDEGTRQVKQALSAGVYLTDPLAG
ncbi:SDR family oxidoreductase [Mitsuaria sp. CC2]|uniref:SDR family oxidoreductase n=1 Tax=Mitsuaria sp. CC2 TaxID=3029186 RepID=UPI003B8E37A7